MTKKIYLCNVCRDEFSKDRMNESGIVGFDFIGGSFKTDRWSNPGAPHNHENHICKVCLKNASEMLEALREAGEQL